MRILDEIENLSLKRITIYLTQREALELRDSLEELLKRPINNHAHISSENFEKEITVCIYDIKKLNEFNQRSIDLIKNDE